jgi:hypothetical protein
MSAASEAIELNPNGAVMSVLNIATQVDAVKIAIGSYLEGKGLKGDWRLEITGAKLVRVPGPPKS